MTLQRTVLFAALLSLGLLLAACQAPPVYERHPEPRHADQDSLLVCPECGGFGLVECPGCKSGGQVCHDCEGFGIVRCPDCKLVMVHSDTSPERDLYYTHKTLGGGDTGMEEFEAKVFAEGHLHGIDRRRTTMMSSAILAGKRCKTCNSRGYVACPSCVRGIHVCPVCRGKLFGPCPLCRASGYVPSLTGEKVKSRGRIIRKRKR